MVPAKKKCTRRTATAQCCVRLSLFSDGHKSWPIECNTQQTPGACAGTCRPVVRQAMDPNLFDDTDDLFNDTVDGVDVRWDPKFQT